MSAFTWTWDRWRDRPVSLVEAMVLALVEHGPIGRPENWSGTLAVNLVLASLLTSADVEVLRNYLEENPE